MRCLRAVCNEGLRDLGTDSLDFSLEGSGIRLRVRGSGFTGAFGARALGSAFGLRGFGVPGLRLEGSCGPSKAKGGLGFRLERIASADLQGPKEQDH